MSPLLDELSSVLKSFREHVQTWTNQGLVVSIDNHLHQLEAAASLAKQDAETAVNKILADLYTAFHAPQPDAPAPAPADTPPAAPAEDPAPATGGTVAGPGPVLVGESGPETVTLPEAAPVTPAAAAEAPQSDVVAPAEAAADAGPAAGSES